MDKVKKLLFVALLLLLGVAMQSSTYADENHSQEIGVLPVRAVLEGLGYNVFWEQSNQRVILYGYGQIVVFEIGGSHFTLNGVQHALESPPRLVNDRTMMQMDALLYQLGFEIAHEGTNMYAITQIGARSGTPFTFAAGFAASFAINTDGTLLGWGSHAMLPRIDITENQLTPTPIMENVIAVYANAQSDHAAAITADGGLWLWGRNNSGQIGDGTRTLYSGYHEYYWQYIAGEFYGTDVVWDNAWLNHIIEDNTAFTPVRVMDNVAAVALGTWHSMAIRTDGSLWVWGTHDFSENGFSTSPVHVMDDVIAVSAGLFHTLALNARGELWAWGVNFWGVITYPVTWEVDEHIAPMLIMEDVIAISAATFHSMAITSCGTLWGWGENGWGQLGDGTWQHRFSPVRIMDGVAFVATYAYATMVITIDGRLYEWGEMLQSRYSDEEESAAHLLAPRFVMDDVLAVNMSYTHNMALRTDGSLWAWGGSNASGQIGDGTITRWVTDERGRSWMSDDNRRPYPVLILDDVLK